MKAIVVVGLPGSGKTTFCNEFIKSNDYVFIDEPKNKNFIEKYKNSNLIIASPWFCSINNRKQIKTDLEEFNYTVSFIYFEKNYNKAKINCEKRLNKKINLDFWFNFYEPEGNNFMEINV